MSVAQFFGVGMALTGLALGLTILYYRWRLGKAQIVADKLRVQLTQADADISAFNAAALRQVEAISSLQDQVDSNTISGKLAVHEVDNLRLQVAACRTPQNVVDRLNAATARLAGGKPPVTP